MEGGLDVEFALGVHPAEVDDVHSDPAGQAGVGGMADEVKGPPLAAEWARRSGWPPKALKLSATAMEPGASRSTRWRATPWMSWKRARWCGCELISLRASYPLQPSPWSDTTNRRNSRD